MNGWILLLYKELYKHQIEQDHLFVWELESSVCIKRIKKQVEAASSAYSLLIILLIDCLDPSTI